MDYLEYIIPELIVLVPVLFLLGRALKGVPQVGDWLIPFILGGAGIVLAAMHVCSVMGFTAMGLFTAITQGVLCAGMSVYGHQLVKQFKDKDGGNDNG